ncbi:hypothetical protein QCD79_32485, partial [Pseudomonas quasicaspiana]|nr:hypothetical protein [Pseudomonas quasicaspiana]
MERFQVARSIIACSQGAASAPTKVSNPGAQAPGLETFVGALAAPCEHAMIDLATWNLSIPVG